VTGLILLVVIGLMVAWVLSKARGKMKLPMNGKHWVTVVIVVVVLLAIAYGASGHVSGH
jgi:hypothetical protein